MYGVLTVWALTATAVAAVSRYPPMLIVSFDGFRTDYIRPDLTPNLAKFRDAAASPPYMRNAFPTKTYVNHFTMATGMNPETHGVIDNYMFGPNDEKINYSYEQFHFDESIVPLWIQNEYSGDDRHSGVMMWTASDFPYQNNTPTYTQKYNTSLSWTSRIDQMISWILDDEKPANLVMAYFEEPDSTGHQTGVGSQNVTDQVVRVDVAFRYLLEKIKSESLHKKLNLIIVSDHGMDTVTYDGVIYLDKYVSNNTYKIVTTGPNAFVKPLPGKYDEVYDSLKKGAEESGNFEVYKQDQLLDRWHMKNTPRLNGIIYLLAQPKFMFWDDYLQTILDKTTHEDFRVGTHGYDNTYPNMRAVFMASGPSFKKNFAAVPFDNVDIYPLAVQLLGLKEPAVRPNGTLAGVQQLLLVDDVVLSTTAASPPALAVCNGMLAAAAAAVALMHVTARRH